MSSKWEPNLKILYIWLVPMDPGGGASSSISEEDF
jgi:hypothetical protein